jgi:hypothetical protein
MFVYSIQHQRLIRVPGPMPYRHYLNFLCLSVTYTKISLKYNQQDATFSLSIYFYKLLYMFQAVPPPIIKSTKLYIQRHIVKTILMPAAFVDKMEIEFHLTAACCSRG